MIIYDYMLQKNSAGWAVSESAVAIYVIVQSIQENSVHMCY